VNAELSIQREYELFEAASRMSRTAARRAFLKQACSQDPVMRGRVEELLALQSNAEKFFAAIANELPSVLQREPDIEPPKPEGQASKGAGSCNVSRRRPRSGR
jgi:hypothetical protein